MCAHRERSDRTGRTIAFRATLRRDHIAAHVGLGLFAVYAGAVTGMRS
jgi:hypothetical protein